MNFDSWKNDKYFKYVLLFSIVVAFAMIFINSTSDILGIFYIDPYFYLIESLRFSGYYIGGYEYIEYLPPLVPFLTSLLFRLGFVSESSLFFVTGIFYIPAVVGVYALLKLRFNNKLACFGAIFYGCLSVNIMSLANGTIDIPSVALSIWAVYTFILAMEKNQKYFYLAFPLALLSGFAKYIGLLIVAVMVIYFLSKKDILHNIPKYIKNIVGGILTCLIFIIPFLAYYYFNNIPFGFLDQASEISSHATLIGTAVPTNNLYFYLLVIPQFICKYMFVLGIPMFLIFVFIGVYVVYKLRKIIFKNYPSIENKISLSFLPSIKLSKSLFYATFVLSILLMIIAFVASIYTSFITCELIFFIGILLFVISFNSIYKGLNENRDLGSNKSSLSSLKQSLKEYNYEFFSFDVAIYSWFVIYLIFFTSHLVKVDRYFIIHSPSFTIICIMGLSIILGYLNFYSKNLNLYENSKKSIGKIKFKLGLWNDKYNLGKLIVIILLCFSLINCVSFIVMDHHDTLVDDEKQTTMWIKENLPANSTFCSDRGPIYTWYLKTNVAYDINSTPINNLSTFLNENDAGYYITTKNSEIPDFLKLNRIGEVSVYKNLKYVKDS